MLTESKASRPRVRLLKEPANAKDPGYLLPAGGTVLKERKAELRFASAIFPDRVSGFTERLG